MNGSSSSVFRSVRRPPRRRWLRTLKMVLAGLLVVSLVAVGIVAAVWAEAWLRLGGEEVPALTSDLEALGTSGPRAPGGATTVLVALVSEHDPQSPEPPSLVGDVALVQVAEQRDETAVVLLPETLEVSVDGEGELPLGEVHERGGLDLLVRSVVDYSGVALDHALAASVDALPGLVEALDGAELDADEVRRATTEGGSVERAEAAARVLQDLAGQVGPSTPLRSPLRSRAVISVLADEVVTDASLRGMRVLDVAEGLAADQPVVVAAVPGVQNPETGSFVVRYEQAVTLFQHLQQGTALADDGLAEASEDAPQDVTVAVLNGTGTAGLAGRVESQLQGAGFQVTDTGNAVPFGHEQTVVAYGPDDPDAEVAAVLLAERLGDVALEASERPLSFEGEPVDVVVTVGQDLDDEEDE